MNRIVSASLSRSRGTAALPLRILFFLEPVIYRGEPAGVSAHFQWVEAFARAARASGGSFVLCANDAVCASWRQTHGSGDLADFPVELEVIDPFEVLAADRFERVKYSKAAYGQGTEGHPLLKKLIEVRQHCKPGVVVISGQNAMADVAFEGLNLLFIEQAPLPRLGHPFRTQVDPCGHQVGTSLERFAARIRTLQPPAARRAELSHLYDSMVAAIAHGDERAERAQRALDALRGEGESVALLVTQPVDAVTFEGAGHAAELENILYEWATALPPGWIGVPTYHAGQRLSGAMERALARSCNRLRFLSADFSQGLSEALLMRADGMVTVSSTAAMAGLLLGKRVVVTGRGPLSSWSPSEPGALATAPVLARAEAESVLCFLTNRHSHPLTVWQEHPESLVSLITQIGNDKRPRGEWLLDTSDWTLESARKLFNFRFCVSSGDRGSSGCFRPGYEAQLAETQAQLATARDEALAARAERDAKAAELAATAAQLESYQREWQNAVADRDRLLRELATEQSAFAEERSGFAAERQRWEETRTQTSAQADLTVLAAALHELQARVAALGSAEASHHQALQELDHARSVAAAMRAEISELQRDSGAAAALQEELRLARGRELDLQAAERQVKARVQEVEHQVFGLQAELAERSSQYVQEQQRVSALECLGEQRAHELAAALDALRQTQDLQTVLRDELDAARGDLESSRQAAVEDLERHRLSTALVHDQDSARIAELDLRLAEAGQMLKIRQSEVVSLEAARKLEAEQQAQQLEALRAELSAELSAHQRQGLASAGTLIAERHAVSRLLMDALERVRANESALMKAHRERSALQRELSEARVSWTDEAARLVQERSACQAELSRVSLELQLAQEELLRWRNTLGHRLRRWLRPHPPGQQGRQTHHT